jgi:hypothetical protein
MAACNGNHNHNSGESDGSDPALDAGIPPDAAIPLPTLEKWTFYGTAQGGPQRPYGVTADQGGNIWVAGGEEGLFLLRSGSSTFQRFTMDDGLHPYGYPRLDQGTITRTYLNAISVAGGPAGTVFVGYMGMPTHAGEYGCEDNWDGPDPDPNIYKSGDADKVVLTGSSITVVHYDISTGANIVQDEMRGREKLCDVYRIVYDASSRSLWFGANHGYAWGEPDYQGDPNCFGQFHCAGLYEHAHPLLNGYATESATDEVALTNYYWGLTVEPSGNLWVGGMFRSQYCPSGMHGLGFFDCDSQGSLPKNQIDWWPDQVHTDSRPSQRVDDNVSGMSLSSDGSLWIGSFNRGLARRDANGSVTFFNSGLVDPQHVTAVRVDPSDGSVWVGAATGGMTRIKGGQLIPYDARLFGGSLVSGSVPDIQVDSSGGTRRILVAFSGGAIGVYEGD